MFPARKMLVQVLVKIVKKKDYYTVKEITQKMREEHGTGHKWLTNEWVGRNLKKIGFHEKRRLANATEYFLTPNFVHHLALVNYVPIPESDLEDDSEDEDGDEDSEDSEN